MTPIVHIVPHTHWDREWYHSAARFQLRLARLIDEVVEQLAGKKLPAFLLDGQGVVLDDYFAMRPEARKDGRWLMAAGRIECGPWYVLADNLTVSGEALVRNLIEGGKAVRRAGGQPMAVGYAPDAFGHPAILPTVLAGFGIRTAITWRGFGGEPGQDQDLYRWRGPDSSDVLMIHLPPPGYEYGANLPADPRAAETRWQALRALLEPRARAPHWLVLNGADHHALQPDLPEALEQLAALAPDAEVRLSSLGEYARAVAKWARRHETELPLIDGELRAGRRHAWALQGTFSSRGYLKQANALCQRLLERVAEPLVALAEPGKVQRAELEAAWRTLLENHPHDSICGTSTDAVHREMMIRFARCRSQTDEIAQRALDVALDHDPAAARVAAPAAWQPALAVFNPSASRRSAVVEADVERFVAHLPVGPSSARRAQRRPVKPGLLVLKDPRGRSIPFQFLGRGRTRPALIESPRHYPDCDTVLVERVALAAEDLPPLGIRAFTVHSVARRTSHVARGPVRVSGMELENGLVRARVESDGSLAMARIGSGWNAHGLGRVELMADEGDSYTSAPRGPDLAAGAAVAGDIAHEGPLVSELRVWRDAAGEGPPPWTLYQPLLVRLQAGEPFARLTMPRQWLGAGLRLRLAFALGESPARVVADGPFGPVERVVTKARAARRGETEATPATAPLQRYVSVAGRGTGLTVFTDGLQEYEVRPDGTLFITLERTFSQVSRPDLPERPGHAAWPSTVIQSHTTEPGEYRLAVLVHDPAALDTREEIEEAADAFLARPVGFMRRALLDQPGDVVGPELVGDGLVFSAMKPAESGKGIVLRCYNARHRPVLGSWILPRPAHSANLCRLDETPVARLEPEGRVLRFEAAPRAIVTILVRPKAER